MYGLSFCTSFERLLLSLNKMKCESTKQRLGRMEESTRFLHEIVNKSIQLWFRGNGPLSMPLSSLEGIDKPFDLQTLRRPLA